MAVCSWSGSTKHTTYGGNDMNKSQDIRIAVIEERIKSIIEKQKDIEKEIKETEEWARDQFKRIWDKENNEKNETKKSSIFGGLLKIG